MFGTEFAHGKNSEKKHPYSIALFAFLAHYGAMADKSKTKPEPAIREQDVRGLKYFDQLAPLLERLRRRLPA